MAVWLRETSIMHECLSCIHAKAGPEEPVRLLRFWPDQYFKLQQYFFQKTKKNTYRNVDLYRYRFSRAGVVKRHFDGCL